MKGKISKCLVVFLAIAIVMSGIVVMVGSATHTCNEEPEQELNDNEIMASGGDDYIYSVSRDSTLRKLDSDGNEVWSYDNSGDITTDINGMAVDSQENIYIAVNYELHKVHPNGTNDWVYDLSSFTNVPDVDVDSTGVPYVLARTTDTSPSSSELKRIIEDSDGNPTEDWSYNIDVLCESVAVADNDTAYVGEYYMDASVTTSVYQVESDGTGGWIYSQLGGTIYLDEYNGSVYAGDRNAEVHKINPNGTQNWTFTGHSDIINGVYAENYTSIYTASADYSVKKLEDSGGTGTEVWNFTELDGRPSPLNKGVGSDLYIGTWNVNTGDENNVQKITEDSDGNPYRVWNYTQHTDYVMGVSFYSSTLSADFSFSRDNTTFKNEIQFTNESSEGNYSITDYYWEFGDGNTSTEENPTHNYSEAKDYDVTLTVTDSNGGTDSITKTITVDVKVNERTVLDSENNRWLGRPRVVEAPNGNLIMLYRNGSEHNNNGDKWHIRYSDDDGESWTGKDTRLDESSSDLFPWGTNYNEGDVDLILAPNGDIVATVNRDDRDAGTRLPSYQLRSTDNGETWTNESEMDWNDTGGYNLDELYMGQDSDVYDGTIYSIVFVDPSGDATMPFKTGYAKSTDNGTTWDYVSDISDTELGTNEGGIISMGNGEFLTILRDDGNSATYKSVVDESGNVGTIEDITSDVGIVQKPVLNDFGSDTIYMVGRYVSDGWDISNPGFWMREDSNWTYRYYFDKQVNDTGYSDIWMQDDGSMELYTYDGDNSEADLIIFDFEVKDTATRYDLTINIDGNGTTTPAEGTHTYDEGTEVTIDATPDSDYVFSHWEGDVSSTSNSVTVTMDSDKTITAVFNADDDDDGDDDGIWVPDDSEGVKDWIWNNLSLVVVTALIVGIAVMIDRELNG